MALPEVKQALEALAKEINKVYGTKWQWEGEHTIQFTHHTGNGTLSIQGTNLKLSVKMKMLYAATTPMIKKKIIDWADENIS
jgi:acyl-homoserine lactone acylase PvdQ